MKFEDYEKGLEALEYKISRELQGLEPSREPHQEPLDAGIETKLRALFLDHPAPQDPGERPDKVDEKPEPFQLSDDDPNPEYLFDPSLDAARASNYQALLREVKKATTLPPREQREAFEALGRIVRFHRRKAKETPSLSSDEQRKEERDAWVEKHAAAFEEVLKKTLEREDLSSETRKGLTEITTRVIAYARFAGAAGQTELMRRCFLSQSFRAQEVRLHRLHSLPSSSSTLLVDRD